ncbi:hypothetical protein QYF61_007435 [Mycteria americana]|uniref:Uncharacterized protein n=1 Tax=Mycteria americana TaxID=33587 RepID=A0AAN7NQ07_MYCAM|nr:hypothetical protein QYF61_007435 [Mycteria americana]
MWSEVLFPLSSALLRYMWVLHAVLGSPVKETHGHTGVSAVNATKSAGCVQPAEEKAQGDLNYVYKYLMGRREGGEETRGNGHKLKYMKLH